MRMKWDTDRIVSISAMLVGLGSLFIVLYQTTLMPPVDRTVERSAADKDPTDRAVLEIDYASVYGERWRLRSDRVVPEPL
jgi:hypothetical protein